MQHRKDKVETEKQKGDGHIGRLQIIALVISVIALLVSATQLTRVSYSSGYVKGYGEAIEAVESALLRGGANDR